MASPSDENLLPSRSSAALHDAVTPKRPRLEASPCSMQRVLDVENLLRGLLTLLDLASLVSFLEILANNESWRGILAYQTLWKELLSTHFKGTLPPAEEFQEDSEEDSDEDEADDVMELDEMEMEEILDEQWEEDDAADNQDGEQDQDSAAKTQQREEPDAEPMASLSSNWVAGLPSQKVLELACPELKELLRSAEQLLQFDAQVQIIQGDVGEITTVGRQRVDGIAFPTAAFLRNPHSGVAAVIFRRAGQELSEHVRKIDIRLDVGQVHATPGFATGVDKLLHIVGPSRLNPNCLRELQRTYRNVLRCVQEERLNCVAMTSVSTGNMGLPVDKASWFALCAMQRFMRSTNWASTIAMVCYEPEVYAAFAKNKAKLLAAFNADSIRADPPLERL